MDDALLWQQFKAGSKVAFEKLYRRHAEALLLYGYKFSESPQLVEDCLQDLFISLWEKRRTLSQVAAVRPYLLVALRRRIIRELSRQNRYETADAPGEAAFATTMGIDEQMAADELSAEQQQQVQEALGQLSARQREAIYLKYQLDMDYETACQVMGISYQSARNLVATALKRLKAIVVKGWWLLYFFFY